MLDLTTILILLSGILITSSTSMPSTYHFTLHQIAPLSAFSPPHTPLLLYSTPSTLLNSSQMPSIYTPHIPQIAPLSALSRGSHRSKIISRTSSHQTCTLKIKLSKNDSRDAGRTRNIITCWPSSTGFEASRGHGRSSDSTPRYRYIIAQKRGAMAQKAAENAAWEAGRTTAWWWEDGEGRLQFSSRVT